MPSVDHWPLLCTLTHIHEHIHTQTHIHPNWLFCPFDFSWSYIISSAIPRLCSLKKKWYQLTGEFLLYHQPILQATMCVSSWGERAVIHFKWPLHTHCLWIHLSLSQKLESWVFPSLFFQTKKKHQDIVSSRRFSLAYEYVDVTSLQR